MFALQHSLIGRVNPSIFNFNNNYIGVVSLCSFCSAIRGCCNLRGSYALILLILNNFLMQHPENENKTEVTVNQFETQLAYWLDSFDGHLEFIPNAQQLLHDVIMSVKDQCYNEKEVKVVKSFLNSALSLTFLLKDNSTDLQKFINYKTQN